MGIKKKSFKQFEIEFQQRIIDKREFYLEMAATIFERKKQRFEFNFGLGLSEIEKQNLLTTEIALTRNLLAQPGLLQVVKAFESNKSDNIIREIEDMSEETLEIIYRTDIADLKEVYNAELDIDSVLDDALQLEIKEIDTIVIDILSRKKYFDYLCLQLETVKFLEESENLLEDYVIEEEYMEVEEVVIDSSLVKWNRKKGEFYFFMDSLVESGIISLTEISKKDATEQIARCFGLELADSWQRTKSDEYKAERKLLENGKTTLFKDLVMAFDRLIERRDMINNDKDEKDALVRQEIKAKKSQIK